MACDCCRSLNCLVECESFSGHIGMDQLMWNGFVVYWDRMGFLLNQTGHLHSHSHGPSQPSQSQAHGHGHGHGHGHQRGHGSLAVRAAFIHALGDLVQSIGVLIAAYVVRFKVSWVTGMQHWESKYLRKVEIILYCIVDGWLLID